MRSLDIKNGRFPVTSFVKIVTLHLMSGKNGLLLSSSDNRQYMAIRVLKGNTHPNEVVDGEVHATWTAERLNPKRRVVKSPADQKHSYWQVGNGLTALLIHDPLMKVEACEAAEVAMQSFYLPLKHGQAGRYNFGLRALIPVHSWLRRAKMAMVAYTAWTE